MPWLYLALFDTTSLYHGSTWLYLILNSTTLYHGSTWLYLTLLHSKNKFNSVHATDVMTLLLQNCGMSTNVNDQHSVGS